MMRCSTVRIKHERREKCMWLCVAAQFTFSTGRGGYIYVLQHSPHPEEMVLRWHRPYQVGVECYYRFQVFVGARGEQWFPVRPSVLSMGGMRAPVSILCPKTNDNSKRSSINDHVHVLCYAVDKRFYIAYYCGLKGY